MNDRLAYAIGFHPWGDLAEHPAFAGKLVELVAREEDGHGPPHGRALDLGRRRSDGRGPGGLPHHGAATTDAPPDPAHGPDPSSSVVVPAASP